MHELWLGKQLLAMVLDHAESHRVTSIILEVGDSAMINTDALLFSFDLLTKNTVAEGAVLDIRAVSGNTFRLKSIRVT